MTDKELARFTAKYVVSDTGCWLWTACKGQRFGYARFGWRGRTRNAHIVSYLHYKGAIPPKYDLDHLCRVRHCVNPDHLEAVTRRENLLRGVGLTAQRAQRTHCPQGHPYSEVNTILEKDRGYIKRRCHICRLARQYAYNRRVRKGETKCWQDYLK